MEIEKIKCYICKKVLVNPIVKVVDKPLCLKCRKKVKQLEVNIFH